MREAICLTIQGEREVVLGSRDEIKDLAESIRTCDSQHFADEVGHGSLILPPGSRIQLKVPSRHKGVTAQRKYLAKYIERLQEGSCLHVFMLPLRTSRAPPLDPFGKELFTKEPKRTLKQLAESKPFYKERAFDNLLLLLLDALLLTQSEDW